MQHTRDEVSPGHLRGISPPAAFGKLWAISGAWTHRRPGRARRPSL